MRGAVLVTGWPPGDLFVTVGKTTLTLQEAETDWYVSPSISQDGQLIASAHLSEEFPHGDRTRPKLKPSVYSAVDHTWTFYKELTIYDGSVAISPDGRRLACITRKESDGLSQVAILERQTKKIAEYEQTNNASGHLSWSPDGRQIVFERESFGALGEIFVLNLEKGSVLKLAEGRSPVWSPSSEWIAFYEPGTKLSAIHPDGSARKTFRQLGRHVSNVTPVWSPDSKGLFVSKWHGDNNDWVDIYYLDVATNGLTKKFTKVSPIYAWIRAD